MKHENSVPSFVDLFIARETLSGLMKQFIQREQIPVKMEQVAVLLCIRHYGVLCQQELAERVSRDKSSIQRTVVKLRERGIISIQQDKEDRRKNLLTLMPAGNGMQ